MRKFLLQPKQLLLAITLMCAFGLKAQYATIPDNAFANWLRTNGFAACMNGNQLDTTCPAVLNKASLFINDSSIHSVNGLRYFKKLDSLRLYHPNVIYTMHIDTLDDLPLSLKWLWIQKASTKHITYLPDSLNYFYLGTTTLQQLPSLPAGLQTILFAANSLTSLPPLPPSLVKMTLSFENNMSSLPPLTATALTYLQATNCGLTSLPTLPSTLNWLDVSSTFVDSLPALNDSLQVLKASGCRLRNFPPLPNGITYFDCGNNPLYSLPVLPDSLKQLYCSYDSLTSLPALPPVMRDLFCDHNQLISLPTNIITNRLGCSYNSITSITGLRLTGFGSLHCNNNQLTSLDVSYGAINQLVCSNNPNLSCLPHLDTISTLDFTNTGVSCLPNYGTVGTSTPPLNSVPLCLPVNSNGCPIEWSISGKVYLDANTNCQPDNSDSLLRNIKVQLWKNGVLVQQTLTGGEGLYSFQTGYGSYTVMIDTTLLPFTVACPAAAFYADNTSGAAPFDTAMNFGLTCAPQVDLAAWSIFNPIGLRPATTRPIMVYVGDVATIYGARCAQSSGTVTLTITGPANYVSAAPAALTPTSANNNIIVWNVADFSLVNYDSAFGVVIKVDTTAQLGQQVCFALAVTSTNDLNPANNNLTHCSIISNSFDPNDKQVYPEGDIDTTVKWLTYAVRFQNTGNAPAIHVYVMDTLDSDVDPASFQMLAYSHQNQTQLNGNIIRFNFPDINLPDSTNDEPNSHGYVQYKVKLKPNLPHGTEIKNTAFIYFDFNAPVVTNTTTNTVVIPTVISSPVIGHPSSVLIFPNPAKDYVQVMVDESMKNATLQLTDATGRSILQQQLNSATATINTAHLTAGVYLIRVTAVNGVSAVKRVVVE